MSNQEDNQTTPSQTMATENLSGLVPVGRAILVRHYTPEREGSMIELPDFIEGRTLMLEQRAVVIAIGDGAWPDEAPRAKIGDRVLVSKMAGYQAKGTKDGRFYRLINDRDIFARIAEEE